MVYENRFRRLGTHSERWLAASARQDHARPGGIPKRRLPDPDKTDVVAIGLSCALGYLDWRKPVDWRAGIIQRLVAWLDRLSAREPAFERTRAKDA